MVGQIITKGKSAYRRVRMILSWIKNFGVDNTKYMLQQDKMRRRDIYNMWSCSENEVKKAQKEYASNDIAIQIISVPRDEHSADNWNKQISRGEATYYLCKMDDIILSELAEWAIASYIKRENKQIVYFDERQCNDYLYKPDFGIDTALAQNYFGDAICISKELWNKIGGFDKAIPYAALYDSLIKSYDLYGEKIVGHVNKPVIWRKTDVEDDDEIASCQETIAVEKHLERCGKTAQVVRLSENLRQINYEIQNHPKISIIIPNKDNIAILKQCIDSIVDKSSYDNYEIIIVENNSTDKATFDYYQMLTQKKDMQQQIRVVECVTDWNYSYINNYGIHYASGDYIVLLNNDTEVITADWMEQLLQYAQQNEIGIVGAKLLYPDGTIQHGGVTLGIRGVAGHAFHGWNGDASGYMNRLITVQDLTAVTAACLMMPKEIFDKIDGLDEQFKVAFNDTDLCMRVRKAGYRVVYNPKACLYHHESKSRGSDEQSAEKMKRFNRESMRFQRMYCKELLRGDSYYNDNLRTDSDDFEIREDRIG